MFPQTRADLNPHYEECLRLHHWWAWFLALGIALMVIGALAVSMAVLATFVTILVFGILLMAGGVVQIVNAFLARTWRGFFLHVLVGILHLIVGELMIEHPLPAAEGVTLVLAVCFLFGGTLRIIHALRERFADWGWVLVNGLVTLLLGVLIWRQWPASSVLIIGLFVGIDLLFSGWSWVMLGLIVKAAGPPPQLQAPRAPASVPEGVK
jgi:uncharacterized membrane protein HdeD (DUF308 family)